MKNDSQDNGMLKSALYPKNISYDSNSRDNSPGNKTTEERKHGLAGLIKALGVLSIIGGLIIGYIMSDESRDGTYLVICILAGIISAILMLGLARCVEAADAYLENSARQTAPKKFNPEDMSVEEAEAWYERTTKNNTH